MKRLSDCHVLVTPTSYGRHDPGLRADLEREVGWVTYNHTGKPLSSAALAELLPDVDGYIAGLDTIDKDALAAGKRLQVIARYGVGVDNLDLEEAKARGIVVTNTPGANAASVAELALTLLLLLARPVLPAARETREGGWPRTRGLTLVDKTVGLLGLGAVGKEVARRLQGFDCRVLAYDVVDLMEFAAEHEVELVAIETLLREADFLSLHVPLLPETKQLVNERFLAQMKPGSYLINTSRGEIVDEEALLAALESGQLAGAALDAFVEEPPEAVNPLLQLPQVIATPHMGAHTDGSINAMGSMALAECLAVLRGETPRFRVI